MRGRSDRVHAALAGADAGERLDGRDPDLAVADLVGASRRDDGVDHTVDVRVVHDDLDAGLRGEEHLVLGATVGLAVAALASEALHLRDGHALDADTRQGVLHIVELERLDDCGDELHDFASLPDKGVLVDT
jgi:hypothetical protein